SIPHSEEPRAARDTPAHAHHAGDMVSVAGRICRPARRHDRREALIGFQGRGCAEVIQPNGCHSFLLEALLFQWLSTERCASRTMMELKTPESNKSVGLNTPGYAE